MFKKIGVLFYINVAVFVLTLVGFIFAIISNSNPGFAFTTLVIVFSIIALVGACGAAFSELQFGNQSIITFVARAIVVALLALTITFIADNRVVDIVNLTSWDTENAVGWSAFYTGAVAMGLYLIAIIASIVVGFFKSKKAAE